MLPCSEGFLSDDTLQMPGSRAVFVMPPMRIHGFGLWFFGVSPLPCQMLVHNGTLCLGFYC